MSRTYRKTQHWVRAAMVSDLDAATVDNSYVKRAEARILGYLAKLRGQDGATINNIGEGSSRKPDGYDSWGYVGGKVAKRFAKRRAARIMRRRGGKDVKARLNEEWDNECAAEAAEREDVAWYTEWDTMDSGGWDDDDDYRDDFYDHDARDGHFSDYDDSYDDPYDMWAYDYPYDMVYSGRGTSLLLEMESVKKIPQVLDYMRDYDRVATMLDKHGSEYINYIVCAWERGRRGY